MKAKKNKTHSVHQTPPQAPANPPAFGLDLNGTFGRVPRSGMKNTTFLSQPHKGVARGSKPSVSAPAANKAEPLPQPTPPETANTPATEDPHANWPEIDPALIPSIPDVHFPIDTLDETTAAFVRDTATSAGVAVGTIAVLFLSTAGAALGNAVRAEGLPGWPQPPILNPLLVGDPSSNKSGALQSSVAPFRAVENIIREEHAECYGTTDTDTPKQVSASRQRLQRAAQEYGMNIGFGQTAHAGPVPPVPQMICGRTTLPGFEKLAKENPKGLLIVQDENVAVLSEDSEFRQMLLSGYQAETHKRTTETKNVDIPDMGFSSMGGIQPSLLRSIYASLSGDGLGSRLLPVLCGRATITRVTEVVDQTSAIASLRILRDVDFAQTDSGARRPRIVPFTHDAGDLIHARRVAAADQQDGEYGIMAGFIGKSHGTVVRLALILACLDAAAAQGPLPTEVGVGLVERAGRIFDQFLLPMARAAFGPETYASIVHDARDLVGILRRLGQPYVSQHALLRANGQKLRKLSELEPVLAFLMSEGVLRFVPGKSTGGRPSDGFDVNPRIWA